ncbi:MAG: hypothetical protein Q9227_002908 [Pyrenula ochraceoflavens]
MSPSEKPTPIPTLFTLPITPSADPSAHITCTLPRPNVYLLTVHSPPDNRLNPSLNHALSLALSTISHKHPPGVVITTSSLPKFYSNGLDFSSVQADPASIANSIFPLFRKLLTYPMPTIALLNGHAFAAGLMLAMFHDYRIMNPAKGFVCLNELDFGATLPTPMASVFRHKVPKIGTVREMTLESRRYSAAEAVKEGIVDAEGELEELLSFIEERKLVEKAQSKSYGPIKQEIYRDMIQDIDQYPGVSEAMKSEKPKL